jgi:hypothetical protein
MKYLGYLNILLGDNYVQNSGNCKKGNALRTTLVLHIGLKKSLSINFHQKNVTLKNRHIDIIAQILQTFTVRFLKYFNLCFSWIAPKKNEIVEESYHTPILC